jgi:hypothetical protein
MQLTGKEREAEEREREAEEDSHSLSKTGIERLTALEDLALPFCTLEPSCLLDTTTCLTMLALDQVDLQPSEAQQDSALGAAQLLQVLARCVALQELRVNIADACWPQQQLSPYSALTASSHLQQLHISNSDSSIPGAAWAHVFPAGRTLPNLLRVTMRQYDDHPPAGFDSTAIARLASCCPAVEDLTFRLAADASLFPLQSLTALTCLHIGPISPAVISSDLAALSQLRSLYMYGAGLNASDQLQQLLPLTALTGLTELRSRCDGRDMWLLSKVSHPQHCMHACTPEFSCWHV